jgi:transposase InsO family protein
MLVINDFSKLTWVAFLREKYDVFDNFKKFKALAENQTGRNLKAIFLDKGGEFMSRYFRELCDRHGIKREYTITGSPQQNGVVERQNTSVQ